jgi:hypothetical protein
MVCDGDPPCSMYFETVDWATSKPSITLATERLADFHERILKVVMRRRDAA